LLGFSADVLQNYHEGDFRYTVSSQRESERFASRNKSQRLRAQAKEWALHSKSSGWPNIENILKTLLHGNRIEFNATQAYISASK
jgi:hypothetical protein